MNISASTRSILRILGCALASLGMLFFLVLPLRQWVSLDLSMQGGGLIPGNKPIRIGLTGYQLMIMANGLLVGSDIGVNILDEVASNPLLKQLYSDSTQRQVRDLYARTKAVVFGVGLGQVMFLLLPIISVFAAILAAVGHPGRTGKLIRSGFLFMSTGFTSLIMIAGLFIVSNQVDSIFDIPELRSGLSLLTLSGIAVGLNNSIAAWMTLPIAFMAVLGSSVSLWMAYISMDQPIANTSVQAVATQFDPAYGLQSAYPPIPLPAVWQPANLPTVAAVTKICPRCSQTIPAHVRFCNKCGSAQ